MSTAETRPNISLNEGRRLTLVSREITTSEEKKASILLISSLMHWYKVSKGIALYVYAIINRNSILLPQKR